MQTKPETIKKKPKKQTSKNKQENDRISCEA